MSFRILLLAMALSVSAFAQMPPIEPGVSQELAKWRAVRYSDVRYKLNLTLEKTSPVLKGTMEIRLSYAAEACAECPPRFIVLDWRKIRGHEEKSTITNVSLNGRPATLENHPVGETPTPLLRKEGSFAYREENEHLIFSDGVVMGENVIKLDFTSPILTSGSAITRYVDKEDGSEYLYSLFVPSDASTAFPVFDQPDIKARFELTVIHPSDWSIVANEKILARPHMPLSWVTDAGKEIVTDLVRTLFSETKPISTYVFAFAAGPFEKVSRLSREDVAEIPLAHDEAAQKAAREKGPNHRRVPLTEIYVRKSQRLKFEEHSKEVFRLNSEAVKYFEEYFDYKFPFPKYDLVLIPEFPFGGMEHAGATFLREASIIFPQEPTKNDHINRATLIFHEAAHQWFGDTVTMRWFDDLWLKEGFATFTAYKAMEKIMPEMNAWKVFYERVKQAAYQTDSTKGTTAIYQPIANLSAAKSAYGNIVYNKAPAFLRQAEFYLGEDKFQAAVRAFLKRHEFGNAGWEDLVKEFATASNQDLNAWANSWVKQKSLSRFKLGAHLSIKDVPMVYEGFYQSGVIDGVECRQIKFSAVVQFKNAERKTFTIEDECSDYVVNFDSSGKTREIDFVFPNHQDFGYGIFLLDEKSRDYVLKSIQNEKDPFLRSMMWGALWDSVREGELDPREYVGLVVRVQSSNFSLSPAGTQTSLGNGGQAKACTLNDCDDESTTALLLNRVGTAMNYYIDDAGTQAPSPASAQRAETYTVRTSKRPMDAVQAGSLRSRVEDMLIAGMRNSPTLGQRITYYRAFLNIASSEKAKGILKEMFRRADSQLTTPAAKPATPPSKGGDPRAASIPLKTKDRFDIVTRLLILNDSEAAKLLAELEKTETGDDAKRYAYAARAGIATAENKSKYWNDFVNNKEISESWIEAAFGPWNSIRHSELTLPYLQKALQELPNHKRNRKIFFVNGWLGAFIGGQRSEEALAIVNKFLADNPKLDNDLRLKVLENVDVIERAVRIRKKY